MANTPITRPTVTSGAQAKKEAERTFDEIMSWIEEAVCDASERLLRKTEGSTMITVFDAPINTEDEGARFTIVPDTMEIEAWVYPLSDNVALVPDRRSLYARPTNKDGAPGEFWFEITPKWLFIGNEHEDESITDGTFEEERVSPLVRWLNTIVSYEGDTSTKKAAEVEEDGRFSEAPNPVTSTKGIKPAGYQLPEPGSEEPSGGWLFLNS